MRDAAQGGAFGMFPVPLAFFVNLRLLTSFRASQQLVIGSSVLGSPACQPLCPPPFVSQGHRRILLIRQSHEACSLRLFLWLV
jgi:hypothetical protein